MPRGVAMFRFAPFRYGRSLALLRFGRSLALGGFAAGLAAGGVLQVALTSGGGGSVPGISAASAREAYVFQDLALVQRTLYHVEESYVEPGRIDWEAMFVAGLEEVEREVPSVMFERTAGTLALSAGGFDTVLEIDPITSRKEAQAHLQEIAGLLQQNLKVEDLPEEDGAPDAFAPVEYAMITGMLSTLDPHSILLPPTSSREMQVENDGEFGGLGVSLLEDDGDLRIEYPNPGSPAEKAGILRGDRIVRIDGELTTNLTLDAAVERLRGPVDEPVHLQIERDGSPTLLDIAVVRKVIPYNEVRGKLLDGAIGYVRIENFHSLVESGLKDTLAQLAREAGATGGRLHGLVLDLRKNPGGLLDQAIAVSDLFLSEGDIVSTTDGRGRSHDSTVAHADATDFTAPLVVLVDGSSASASEIVAGALRNNDRAVIVGERSFGKGSVQNLYDMSDGSKLKLTTQHYLTPGERSIQGVGIPADIALEPMRVDAGTERPGDEVIALHWREHARREADLDKALVQTAFTRDEESAYDLVFLERDHARDPGPDLDLTGDFQVEFARDLLVSVPSAHRGEMLQAAAPVVARYASREERAINAALKPIGLDWTDGPAAPRASDGSLPVAVDLDLGPDRKLVAGEREMVTVRVTNTGAAPLYRVSALAGRDEPFTDREFWFGRLNPGQTKEWVTEVDLLPGYPTERGLLDLELHDAGPDPLGVAHVQAPIDGRPLPALAWSAKWDDAAPGGDGNGMAEPGEKVRLLLTVDNVGAGPSALPFFRLTSDNGGALDVLNGELAPGKMVRPDGGECPVKLAGLEQGVLVGDPATAPARIARYKLPIYDAECVRPFAPGESVTLAFDLLLRDPPPFADGWHLELHAGDQSAYDHASVMRAGFYAGYTQSEPIVLAVGKPWTDPSPRRPPKVQVTRAPGPAGDSDRVTVSGVVTDETAVRHVMIYAGDNKLFFAGGGATPVRSVPFTADVPLDPGENTITILAEDEDGITTTRSVVTYYVGPENRAIAGNLLSEPPTP